MGLGVLTCSPLWGGRHLRTIRDEDHMGLLKSACFLPAAGLIALGSHMGELRLYDSATGEPAAGADDHSGAVNLLRSWQVRGVWRAFGGLARFKVYVPWDRSSLNTNLEK